MSQRGVLRVWWLWFLICGALLPQQQEHVVVEGKGRGPVGLQSLPDGRHVLVADSSLPGLVLIDLQYGVAVERLSMGALRADPTSVATCGSCHYIFVTGTDGQYFVVFLPHSIRFLLKRYGRLGFETNSHGLSVQVEQLVHPPDQAVDGRLAMATPHGHKIYFTSYQDNAIYVLKGVHRWQPTTASEKTANVTVAKGTALRKEEFHRGNITTTATVVAVMGENATDELEKENIRQRQRQRQRRSTKRVGTIDRTTVPWYKAAVNRTIQGVDKDDGPTATNAQENVTENVVDEKSSDLALPSLAQSPQLANKEQVKQKRKKARSSIVRRPIHPTLLLNSTQEEDLLNPFGISWARKPPRTTATATAGPHHHPPRTPPEMWVALHKESVWKVHRQTGRVLQKINMREFHCPGMDRDPNLRKAMDDPTSSSSLLVLASFPQTYEAVLWRVSLPPQKPDCQVLFGGYGRQSNWRDGQSNLAMFSRPHDFVLYTPPPHYHHKLAPMLICTDIDNRALRLLDLTTGQTSSVMYNRDVKLREGTNHLQFSLSSCRAITAKYPADQLYQTQSPLGQASVMLQSSSSLADSQVTLEEAQSRCASLGMRLCEPSEVRRVFLQILPREEQSCWTRGECASCWKARPNDVCQPSIVGDYRAYQKGHHDEGFEQGWNSGMAMEIWHKDNTTVMASSTYCPGSTDKTDSRRENAPRAKAPCCADCF